MHLGYTHFSIQKWPLYNSADSSRWMNLSLLNGVCLVLADESINNPNTCSALHQTNNLEHTMNSRKNNTSPPSSLGLQQSAHGLKISRRQVIALSAMGMSMGMLSACGGGDDPSAVAASPAPEMPIPPVKPLIALQPGVALFVGDGGGQGNTDSPLRLDNPSAIVQDAAGNLYVSDTQQHCIRRITPQGQVSVFVGSPTGGSGNINGTGTAALFQLPRGLAIVGNTLYIAPSGNNAIRAADLTTAAVTTLANISFPWGLAAHSSGLFVSSFNWQVYYIDLTTTPPTTSLIAGAASPTRGRADSPGELFSGSAGLAWSAANNTLYVADADNNRICAIFDPLGPGRNTSTFAGSSPADSSFAQSGTTDGQGTAARFTQPWGLALAANGTLLVTSYAGRSIRAIATTGANAGLVTTIAGSVTSGSTDGDGSAARFTALEFASIDNNGALLAIDAAGRTIRRISSTDGFSTAANVAVTTPYGIASQTGTLDATGTNARFNEPHGVVADAQGNLYVTDARAHVVRKITPSGAVTTLAGLANTPGRLDGTGTAARLSGPRGICFDAQGNLLIADSNNHAIRRISLASSTLGEVSTVAGSLGTSGSADSAAGGATSTARFNTPYGLAFDRSSQAIYVADYQTQTIRKIAADGSTLTIGTVGTRGNTNTPALFNFPSGLACDSSGNVYVADSTNHLIRKITPTQVVSTLAGSSRGNLDGNGSAAQFFTPFGIAIDAANNLIVAEQGNHTLRRVSTTGATPGDVTTVAGTFGINGGPLAGASLSLPGTLSSPSGVAVVPVAGNFSGVSALYAITSRAGVVVVGLA
jgi:sugar lactone lactonase YvrE